MSPILRFLVGQAVLLVLVLSLPWLVLGNAPVVLELTAPVLCPADQPDARVVEYHTDTGNGVGTSNTLFCMGPDGDLTEVGSWKPLGIVFAAIFLGAEALVLPIQLIGMIRRKRRGPQPPGPSRPLRPGRRIQLGVGFGG